MSAWSFPSRWVASIIGDRIQLNEKHERFLPTKTDLRYINPYWHCNLLLTIADADRKTFAKRFESIFVLSLRVDVAVDKQRIDNKHVMAIYITAECEHLGFSQSDERGSAGLYSALKAAVSKYGVSWQKVFNKVTSIVMHRRRICKYWTTRCGLISSTNVVGATRQPYLL